MGIFVMIIGWVVPLVLLAGAISPAVRQLRGATDPLRALSEVVESALLLGIVGLFMPLPGWGSLLWWLVLVVVAAAVIVTWLRGRGASIPRGKRGEEPSRAGLAVKAIVWLVVIILGLVAA